MAPEFDCTELAPWSYCECDHPRCGRIYRSGLECPAHGRTARALDAIDSLELERKLLLSVSGGTTDGGKLARLATLEKRVVRLRGYIARRMAS